MNRIFEIEIIQPKFDELYKKYEKMFAEKKSMPAAIKIGGKLKGTAIEDNTTMGMGLLEANEIEDSSIKRNKSFLFNSKGNIEKVEIIKGDKIEQHGGENKATINNNGGKESLLSKFFWYFVVGLLVVVFGSLIVNFLLK